MNTSKITPDTEVSVAELACVLGVTGRRIHQMVEDGQIERITRGKFNLCDCVQRYCAFLNRGRLEEDDLINEKARRSAEASLKMAKAAIAKMEASEMEGKMHRSEDVAAMTEDLIFTIRGMLLSLPGRLADDTYSADSAAEAEAIIRKEVFEVMEALSRYQYDPRKYEERVRDRQKWMSGEPVEGDDAECRRP